MNMTAALIGYGSFVLSLLAIGIIGYWKAESLAWISHRSPASLADCAGCRHYRSFAAVID